ncbi:MAG: STAS domain-containing protein [Planctomycetota bacterium]|nr:STAS domain-containing protein [Planctomycetota bacterium]
MAIPLKTYALETCVMWNPFEKQLNKLNESSDAHRISDAAGSQQSSAPSVASAEPMSQHEPSPEASTPVDPYVMPVPAPESSAMDQADSIAEVELMGEVAVATFTISELSQHEGVQLLASLLEEMSETGAKHFVLDIQNIQFMDSMCLGCLVETLNNMTDSGGKIALANSDQNVQQLFRMTRLDRMFPICRDVMTALMAVERERA